MSPWASLDPARPPIAPSVGPFPHAPFLSVWWGAFAEGEPIVIDAGGAVLACVLAGGTLRLAGDADLTDYHAPLGADPGDAVADLVAPLPAGTTLEFDSLPLEAAEPLAKALADAGVAVRRREHAATMVLDVPEEGSYLDAIASKQRHEIRRKSRRFAEALGEPGLERGASGFNAFVEMHRAAPGDKGEFMTEAMEAFFAGLVDMPGAAVDVLTGEDGAPVAAAVGFEDADTYYLYNSSYDPTHAEASPGIVLVDRLIESAAGRGLRRFDFLKGTEDYKRRFGAVPRALFSLEGTAP